ncbi:MAG: hypothetical protein AAFZ09_04710 [Pseudomonadota bacterium]
MHFLGRERRVGGIGRARPGVVFAAAFAAGLSLAGGAGAATIGASTIPLAATVSTAASCSGCVVTGASLIARSGTPMLLSTEALIVASAEDPMMRPVEAEATVSTALGYFAGALLLMGLTARRLT